MLLILCILNSCIQEYKKLNKNGIKKIQTKDYKGAFKDFDLAIRKDSTYWLSYNNRAGIFMHEGNYQKAIEDLDKSIRFEPRNSMAFDNRGMIKKILSDTVGALNDFRTAFTFNKNDIKIQTHLGRLLAELDSCNEAVPLLNAAIKRKAFDDCNSEQELRALLDKCVQSK